MLGNVRIIAFRELGGAGGLPGGSGLVVDSKKVQVEFSLREQKGAQILGGGCPGKGARANTRAVVPCRTRGCKWC